MSNTPVNIPNEKGIAYGLHFHYIRKIPNSKFGFGLGYERIWDEHKHNTIGLVAEYTSLENFNFNISPGLTKDDAEPDLSFSVHFETAYEFEIGNFHIGPAFEYALEAEYDHISIGLHLGFGF
jgi:hypothetical protein